jgi:hypothetical protein
MTEPTTAAGQALVKSEMTERMWLAMGNSTNSSEADFVAAVCAIEAEARAPLQDQRAALTNWVIDAQIARTDIEFARTGKEQEAARLALDVAVDGLNAAVCDLAKAGRDWRLRTLAEGAAGERVRLREAFRALTRDPYWTWDQALALLAPSDAPQETTCGVVYFTQGTAYNEPA